LLHQDESKNFKESKGEGISTIIYHPGKMRGRQKGRGRQDRGAEGTALLFGKNGKRKPERKRDLREPRPKLSFKRGTEGGIKNGDWAGCAIERHTWTHKDGKMEKKKMTLYVNRASTDENWKNDQRRGSVDLADRAKKVKLPGGKKGGKKGSDI